MASLTVLLLAACVSPWPTELPKIPATTPDGFPEQRYRALAATGAEVYAIDTAQTVVQILAFRDGPMARFGHDHVIANRDVHGYALLSPQGVDKSLNIEADVFAALAPMTVDEPDLRRAAGFDTDLSDSARDGTRANMLSSIEAQQFPHVTLNIKTMLESRAAENVEASLRATVTLHAVVRTFEIPARISVDEHALRAKGTFSILQSEFGIEPHKALGGALSVRDRLELRFMVEANRLTVE